jgi:hypothetical protein
MAQVIKFKSVKSDRLFYDQYKYCATIGIDEATALRTLTREYIDHVIKLRKKHRAHTHAWISPWRKSGPITQEVVDSLYTLCDILTNTRCQYKLIVEYSCIRVYTSDVEFVKELAHAEVKKRWEGFKEACVDRPRDTVKLQNPKHKYRSYFVRARINDQEKTAIVQFLKNNQSTLRLSPCLNDWLRQPFKFTEPYYFVDHDDDAWIVMLSLIRPGLIKKTISIIKA